jgi:membrane-associated protein
MVNLISFIMHIDKYLAILVQSYGIWVYLILFVFVFCETGLVVVPFLPGDSLIFAAAALAAKGIMNIKLIYVIFACAAILGDTVNFEIGHFIGPKIFGQEKVRFLKKEYLDKTKKFYEKHGGKTIIIARFIPIVRTFAPFVAGIGDMSYFKFILYNLIGGLLWVSLFIFAGYKFGNMPSVKNNFTIVIFAIIFISVLPGIIGLIKSKLTKH